MSLSAVQEFLTNVSEDQALQEEVAKAMESDNDRQAVADLARSKGFEFTAEELGQEIQSRELNIRQKAEAGELNEDELESIAGGFLNQQICGTVGFPVASILRPIPLPGPGPTKPVSGPGKW